MDPVTLLISGGAIVGTALAAAFATNYSLAKITGMICAAKTVKELVDELGDDDMYRIEGGGVAAWLSEKDMAKLWKIEKRDGVEAMKEEFYRMAEKSPAD